MVKANVSLSTTWIHIGGEEVDLHTFLNSALHGDKCSDSLPVELPARKELLVPIDFWARLAPQSVPTFWKIAIFIAPLGFETRVVQPVAQSMYELHYLGSRKECKKKQKREGNKWNLKDKRKS
jgi:hypothetical protein